MISKSQRRKDILKTIQVAQRCGKIQKTGISYAPQELIHIRGFLTLFPGQMSLLPTSPGRYFHLSCLQSLLFPSGLLSGF